MDKTNIKLNNFQLQPLPRDDNDFIFEKVFGSAEVPKIDFDVAEPIKIKQQYFTDYCPAFAGTAVSEDQEGVELDPIFQMAMIKKISGDIESWGANLRDACKSFVKVGSIEMFEAIFTIEGERNHILDYKNYPKELIEKAKKHKKKSYFRIRGGFDEFVSALWINKKCKQSILTGANWQTAWDNMKIIEGIDWTGGSGHAFKLFGVKYIDEIPYIKAQLSNGEEIGDRGIFLFSKEVIDKYFKYGAFSFSDMPKEQAKFLHKNKLTVKWSWLAKIITKIKLWLN